MFSSRQCNNLIIKVHERSLRIIWNDENRSFETLLQNNKDITVYQRHLQTLMIEVYKIDLKGNHLPSWKNYLFFGKIFIILEISKL